MRLKARPEDFVVREQLEFERAPNGPYFVHVLRKEKLDTLSALARVARLAGVSRAEIAFAGLKDRQGRTEQWISIRGRRVDYRDSELDVAFVGRSSAPITSRASTGNRFAIVVRDLDRGDLARLHAAAEQVVHTGLPNYFDDQRFGCLRHGQGFAMRDVLRGELEEALHRLIARPSPRAITGDVKLKGILAQHWGDFERCAAIARGPTFGRALRHLAARGGDFRGALERLPTRMKLIAAFAYQSFLWNRAVDRLLYRMLPPAQRVALETLSGRLLAWADVPVPTLQRLEAMRTPLFVTPAGDSAFRDAAAEVVEGESIPAGPPLPPIKGMELREEPRRLVVRPRDFAVGGEAPDELARGRRKVELTFGLPRGSYATLVIKRLLARRLEPPPFRPARRSAKTGSDHATTRARRDRRLRPLRPPGPAGP